MTITQTTTQSNLNAGPAANQAPKKDAPFNAVTGKAYFGAKAQRLEEEASYRGYGTSAWATMKQWNSVKETIAKGEKGTLMIHIEKGTDGVETEKRSFVFNRCQLESYQAADCGDKPF